jgi:hypothetical protein
MRSDFITYGPQHWGDANYFYNGDGPHQFGHSLNDSNDAIAFGFQLEKTATISGVGMYLIDIIGSPPDYQLGVVTVSGQSGSGEAYPSDTLYGGGSWQTFDSVAIGSGWSWINLNDQVSGTRGDHIAVVVKPTGSAPDTSNYVEINDESTWYSSNPSRWRFNTSWTRYNFMPPAGIKYTDGTFLGIPSVASNYTTFASPAEWGLEFKLPVGATCIGAALSFYLGTYDAPLKVILANSSDTELASLTSDYDQIGGYDGNYTKITSSASAIPKQGVTFNEESDKTSQVGGTEWKWIERSTPASGWTYYPTRYPWISLLLTDLQGGGGNGGGGGQGGGTYGFIG